MGRYWNLTVIGSSNLAFVAPHGTFPALGLTSPVSAMVAKLPGGTVVQCECDGKNVGELHVTRIINILTDLGAHVMDLDDLIVTSDARLALARARRRVDAGEFAAATADLAIALRGKQDLAIAEYERLPEAERAALLETFVEWQTPRPATWRALKWLPLARWTIDQLWEAFHLSLKTAGVFGAAPGVQGEAILDELARRGEKPDAIKRKRSWLNKTRATEGDTVFRIATDLDEPHAVGASDAGVYIAGLSKIDQKQFMHGAERAIADIKSPTLVLYARDGAELRRWTEVHTDRVVDGVALLTDSKLDRRTSQRIAPRGVRLADGELLYEYESIARHDHELVWGIKERNWAEKQMTSEVRRITGELVIGFENVWIEQLAWDREHIYADDETFDRSGNIVRATKPALPETVTLELADKQVVIDRGLAPWRFSYWQERMGAGWHAYHRGKKVLVAPCEPNAAWVSLEISKAPKSVELAPPWLAFQRDGEPILFVALGEVMSAKEIRVDGKRFAKRAERDPRPRAPRALVEWYEKLLAAEVLPAITQAELETQLLAVFETETEPEPSLLARLLTRVSQYCVEHDSHWLYTDDDFYPQISRALADEKVTIEEVERSRVDDARIRVQRGDREVVFTCEPHVTDVAEGIDAALEELGTLRRLFSLAQYQEDMFAYVAITHAQRERLVAAGIEGIHPSVAMPTS